VADAAGDIHVAVMSDEDFSSLNDRAWLALRKESANCNSIALDLSSVTEVSGLALGRLLKLRNYLHSNMIDFFLLSPSPSLLSAIKRSNLDSEFPNFRTVKEILEIISSHDKKALMISADKDSALIVRHILAGFDVGFIYRYAYRKAIIDIKTFAPSLLITDFSFAMENREELSEALKVSKGAGVLVMVPSGKDINALAGITEAKLLSSIGYPFAVKDISRIFFQNFSRRSSKKLKLMVVDDTKFFRHIVKSNLEDDYDVVCAENGHEAVRMAIEKNPDVILMDVEMPVMDGLTACTRIKNNPSTFNVPVIMLTSHDDVEFRQKARMAGAIDYVLKPPDFSLIRSKIEMCLSAPESEENPDS